MSPPPLAAAAPKAGPRADRRPVPGPARPACDTPPQQSDRQFAALPTLRQLQYLLALSQYRSFSRAAGACCISQSALSGAIKELEATLGTRLVDRDKRHVTITPAGEDAVARARRIVAEAEALTEWAHRRSGPLTGLLRLGIIPTIAPFLLPRILPKLKAAFPDLTLRLREETTARLLEALKAGELDLVLMAFPYDAPGLETAIVGEDPLLLTEPGENAGPATPAGIEDIADRPLLLLADGHCLRDHALAACALPSARVDEFGATSLFTLARMVEAGYGVTLLPKLAVDAGLCDTAKLALRPLRSPAPARKIGLAWRRNAGRADDYKALLDFLKSAGLLPAQG
jgi:LysR family hydrogen peroxide-inducible transcriptional activator